MSDPNPTTRPAPGSPEQPAGASEIEAPPAPSSADSAPQTTAGGSAAGGTAGPEAPPAAPAPHSAPVPPAEAADTAGGSTPGGAGPVATAPVVATAPAVAAERGWRDNLDMLKALFLGSVLTAVFYEIFPLPFLDQGRLLAFFDNSVSPVIIGLTFWSAFILFFKYLSYRRENTTWRRFRDPRVRQVLNRRIYARDTEAVLGELARVLGELKVKGYQRAIIFRRVQRMLHFIRTASRKEGLDSLLDYQAQIELKKLETRYAVLQVFIWAIPILGFIGTVLGIGYAVNEFAGFIQTAEGSGQFGAQMRMALGGVTSGLATAFNTTFLALVLVIPVMLLTSLLQKSEEELLLEIEEFCLEDLLPNLHVTPGEDALSEGFDDHLYRILRLSETWLGQFGPLVERLTRQADLMSHQLSGVQPLVKEFTDRLLSSGSGAEANTAQSSKGGESAASHEEPGVAASKPGEPPHA